VPADAYYGAQTARAMGNFPLSGRRFPRRFVAALGNLKAAATPANMALRVLRAHCRDYAEQSASVVTALAPTIGYDAAARIFKDAVVRGVTIRQAILDAKLLPPERLDQVLALLELTRGGRVSTARATCL
jgi:fumarate hydratase class II